MADSSTGGRAARLPVDRRGLLARDAVRSGDQILVTRVGLSIPTSVTYEHWENAGRKISDIANSSAWCLGDWMVYGQHRYTDRYRRAVELVGLDYQTIRNYAWVARSFALPRRRDSLSFQHHAELAALPPGEQDYWLDQAVRYGWSRNELRRNVRGGGQEELAGDMGDMATASVQLRTDAEKVRRWRAAAARTASTFESWVVEHLDAAASDAATRELAGSAAS
jgi:hypothetical protein